VTSSAKQDILDLNPPRRIKETDQDGNLLSAPPIAPEPLTPIQAAPSPSSALSWVDEQLLVAQIKQEQSTSQSWLLCDRCALNMVPVQQYTTCTSCHNLKFPDGTQWFADELGRRHQI
jgi:hypothetical protein